MKLRYKFTLIFLSCLLAGVPAMAEDNSNVLDILNNAVIQNDPGAKVESLTFTRQKDTKFQEVYTAHVKVKSCYKTRVQCSATGHLEGTSGFSGLFSKPIEKNSTDEGSGVVRIHKKDAGDVSRFVITLTCDPIYSEHPNRYPPNHSYWKQFLPKGPCQ